MYPTKILSGGQTGSDQAGLVVAQRFGLATGGVMPRGFRTLDGPAPWLATTYGLTEHTSADYVPRTYQNVRDADGTVRLAGTFTSRGEVCTLRAIKSYKKPHFDVDLADPPAPADFAAWVREHKVGILNVAGNAEQTYAGAFAKSVLFLTEALFELGHSMEMSGWSIVRSLGLSGEKYEVCGFDADRGVIFIDRCRVS